MQAENQAREETDRLFAAGGWLVQDIAPANLQAGRGVGLFRFSLESGYDSANFVLCVGDRAVGATRGKRQCVPLTDVELRSARYAIGLPPALSAWRQPLPFVRESTGVEIQFTKGLAPEPRSRHGFAFY